MAPIRRHKHNVACFLLAMQGFSNASHIRTFRALSAAATGGGGAAAAVVVFSAITDTIATTTGAIVRFYRVIRVCLYIMSVAERGPRGRPQRPGLEMTMHKRNREDELR